MKRAAALALGAGLILATPAAPARATPEPAVAVAEVPVRFDVVNKNESKVECLPDGKPYQVVGDLVAPRALLETGRLSSVTVYVHGGGNGSFWHFRALPGYDYASAQARAGHASVVLDTLGYGRSDWPNGNDICFGSVADILHQIVGALRSGNYTAGSREPLRFTKVALAAHSGGGWAVELEAYSFQDIDALIIAGFTDNGVDPVKGSFFFEAAARAGRTCSTGGEPKMRPGDPGGYAFVFNRDDIDKLFFDAPSDVKAAFADAWERDGCGFARSLAQTEAANQAFVPTIRTPVLVVAGDHDVTFQNPRAQAARFAGSEDVSLTILPGTGHMLTLERGRADFQRAMSAWLAARGF